MDLVESNFIQQSSLVSAVNYFQNTRRPDCDFTSMKISVIQGLGLDRIKSSPDVCLDSCAR